jgi:hypothetical protein
MPGSNIKINLPYSGKDHNDLTGRNSLYQHKLEAIYRDTDGKHLADILNEMTTEEKVVYFERVIIEDTTTIINLTKFSFNMAKDVLLVDVDGRWVYEGTEEDYVKTGPSQITFNYNLVAGQEVFILLAGTLSGESFGNDVHNELNQFKQLADTPSSYYGNAGKVVTVNDSETGLVFRNVAASHSLIRIEENLSVSEESYWEGWVSFVNSGIIKVIRVTPGEGYTGEYTLSIWTSPTGEWIYYSGTIPDPNIGSIVLYDIMDIAHIDKSTQDSIYVRLDNDGPATSFKVEIIVDE